MGDIYFNDFYNYDIFIYFLKFKLEYFLICIGNFRKKLW